jgi:hypothetical protein
MFLQNFFFCHYFEPILNLLLLRSGYFFDCQKMRGKFKSCKYFNIMNPLRIDILSWKFFILA